MLAGFFACLSPAHGSKPIGATCTWHGSGEQASRAWSTVQFHRPGAWNLMVWRGRLDPVLPLPKSELAEARAGRRSFPVVVPPEAMAGFMGAQYGEVNLYWELGTKTQLFAPSQGLILCSKCEGEDKDCRIYVFTQGGEQGPLMNVFPSTSREEPASGANEEEEEAAEEPAPPPKRAEKPKSNSKSRVTRQLEEPREEAPVTHPVPKDGGDRARLRRAKTAQPEPPPSQLEGEPLR